MTKNQIKLKRKEVLVCPACGSTGVKLEESRLSGTLSIYWMACTVCGSTGPTELSKEDARKAWKIGIPSKQILIHMEAACDGTWIAYPTFPNLESIDIGVGSTPYKAAADLFRKLEDGHANEETG